MFETDNFCNRLSLSVRETIKHHHEIDRPGRLRNQGEMVYFSWVSIFFPALNVQSGHLRHSPPPISEVLKLWLYKSTHVYMNVYI